ncbi:MAG: CCA tRNA nucleotidyltransferase [Proteobacteria bacterium]|nr:CCA tRNA nucleotidyltransferase [Pseudomonadota bacterium]
MKPEIFSQPKLIKKLPQEVKILFKVFGSEIRLVGGCVRDLLLNKKINDFDFATKFLPTEVIKILAKNKIKAVPTGVKFGTITAVVNGKNFEITTLRRDNETDGRHCKPKFIDDFYFDAARRDFTINALYLDSAGLVYDYFAGSSDLKSKKVKFIGNANKRIAEDFLRILRFFRFSNEYAKSLDSKGLAACTQQKENLKKLSRERIRAEILKMLMSDKKTNLIAVLKVLQNKKIAAEIFSTKLDIKALESFFKIEKEFKISSNLSLQLAILFAQKNLDLKIFFSEICATNAEKKYFQFIVENLTAYKNFDQKILKQLLTSAPKEVVLDLYLIALVKNFDLQKISQVKEDIKFLKNFSLPNFPLQSTDLIKLGFVGKKLGAVLREARKIWAENNFALDKKKLLNLLASS